MLGWTVLSQLKQDPATRHIPVQIVTLDEDRQHGLARGAFSFMTKPTHDRGSRRGADPHHRLRQAAPQAAAGGRGQPGRAALASPSCSGTTTSTSSRSTPAPRRWRYCTHEPPDCVVLDLRLPDMSGFEVLERIRDDQTLADRAGRRVHRPRAVARRGCAAAHDGAQRRRQGRRIAGAAARRDRAVPASRGGRPAGGQAAHARAAAQLRRGPGRQDGAAGRRRRAQHLRAEQRPGAARHASADRDHRQRGDRPASNRRRTSRSC